MSGYFYEANDIETGENLFYGSSKRDLVEEVAEYAYWMNHIDIGDLDMDEFRLLLWDENVVALEKCGIQLYINKL